MREHKKIELRSEELQEVMDKIPGWIVRWGIILLFVVVLLLLVGSYLFKYPDTISAAIVLSDYNPPAHIVAKQAGKIQQLRYAEGDSVAENSYLAIIENPASPSDVIRIKQLVADVLNFKDSLLYFAARDVQLGSIQSAYVQFVRAHSDYKTYRALDFHPQKIKSLNDQIAKYRSYYAKQEQQKRLTARQLKIASERFYQDSVLFTSGVISKVDIDESQNQFINAENALIQIAASIDNLSIQISQLESTLLDTQLEQSEKESVLLRELRNSAEMLLNEINGWELNYVLKTPIAGKLSFVNIWSENQNIKIGDEVFVVVPQEQEQLIGRANLPVLRAGKVKTGQRVLVRFNNFPDQEFGLVEGVVSKIAQIPVDETYLIEVAFPQGLLTNYGIELPRSPEMTGTADIVTEELRLIERFVLPVKKLLKTNF